MRPTSIRDMRISFLCSLIDFYGTNVASSFVSYKAVIGNCALHIDAYISRRYCCKIFIGDYLVWDAVECNRK